MLFPLSIQMFSPATGTSLTLSRVSFCHQSAQVGLHSISQLSEKSAESAKSAVQKMRKSGHLLVLGSALLGP